MNGSHSPLRTVIVPLLISGLLSACGGGESETLSVHFDDNGNNPSPTTTPISTPATPTPAISPTVTETPAPEVTTQPPAPQTPTPTPEPLTPTPEPLTPTPIPLTPTPEPLTPTPEPLTPTPLPLTPTPEPSTPSPTPTITPTPTSTPAIAEFGVFTERSTGEGFNLSENSITTYEGDFYPWNDTFSTEIQTRPDNNKILVWGWEPAAGWFGGGIATVANTTIDLTEFSAGNLKFRIQIPANVAFSIGIIDSDKGENWVNFPADQTTYGLVRNGDWAEASIPISDLTAGKVSLQSITYPFALKSVDGATPTEPFELALDDILWEAQSGHSYPSHCREEDGSLYQTDIRCVPPEVIEECDATGGSMQGVGMFYWLRCIYTFNDSETVCTDGSQCDSGSCRDTTAMHLNDTPPTSGYCSSTSNTFLCYREIVNGVAGLPLCRD